MKKGILNLFAACLACAALSASAATQSAPAAPVASEPVKVPAQPAPAQAAPASKPDAQAAAPATDAPVPLSGSYKHEKDHYSMLFEDGKCYGFSQSGEKMRVNCFMKGDTLYLQPVAPKGHALIRNVWIAYKVFDDRLVYSHVEDMDNGEALYKNAGTKAVLIKQK